MTLNKCIARAIRKRLPHIKGPGAVPVFARLKIMLVSTKVFSDLFRDLNIFEFITATEDVRSRKMKPMIEDCFEAFADTLEEAVDRTVSDGQPGAGYRVVYNIVSKLLDTYPICGELPVKVKGYTQKVQLGKLSYNLLVDDKTKLKELFDIHNSTLVDL